MQCQVTRGRKVQCQVTRGRRVPGDEGDARIVTAKHVDTKLYLAGRLTKGLSHVARPALDRGMDETRGKTISWPGRSDSGGTRVVETHI